MTESEKKNRAQMRMDLKARKELLKRLTSPLKRAEAAAKKEYDKRAAHVESLRKYQSPEEAQEAYGYGNITEDEYKEILRAFERDEEYVDNTTTPAEIAAQLLHDYVAHIKKDIAYCEFVLKPKSEQERILRQRDELLARKRSEQDG